MSKNKVSLEDVEDHIEELKTILKVIAKSANDPTIMGFLSVIANDALSDATETLQRLDEERKDK